MTNTRDQHPRDQQPRDQHPRDQHTQNRIMHVIMRTSKYLLTTPWYRPKSLLVEYCKYIIAHSCHGLLNPHGIVFAVFAMGECICTLLYVSYVYVSGLAQPSGCKDSVHHQNITHLFMLITHLYPKKAHLSPNA